MVWENMRIFAELMQTGDKMDTNDMALLSGSQPDGMEEDEIKYPLSNQTFEKIITDRKVYVDMNKSTTKVISCLTRSTADS